MYGHTCTHSRELHAYFTFECENKLSIKLIPSLKIFKMPFWGVSSLIIFIMKSYECLWGAPDLEPVWWWWGQRPIWRDPGPSPHSFKFTDGLNQPLGYRYCMYEHTCTHSRELHAHATIKCKNKLPIKLIPSLKIFKMPFWEVSSLTIFTMRSYKCLWGAPDLEPVWWWWGQRPTWKGPDPSPHSSKFTNGLNQPLGYCYCMYGHTCTHSRELHAHAIIKCKNKPSIKFLNYKNNFIT